MYLADCSLLTVATDMHQKLFSGVFWFIAPDLFEAFSWCNLVYSTRINDAFWGTNLTVEPEMNQKLIS